MLSLGQIHSYCHLDFCVDIACSPFLPFSEQIHTVRIPVDIAEFDSGQFAHATPRAVKHLDNRRLPGRVARSANSLKLNLLQRFSRLCFPFDGFDRLGRID